MPDEIASSRSQIDQLTAEVTNLAVQVVELAAHVEGYVDPHNPHNKRERLWQRVETASLIMAALAGFIAIYVGSKDANEQVSALKDQLGIMQKQLSSIEMQTEENDRARISPFNVGFSSPLVLGGDAWIRVNYQNLGIDPASDVGVESQAVLAETNANGPPQKEFFMEKAASDCMNHGLFGLQKMVYSNDKTSYSSESRISKENITSDLINGNTALLVNGCFVYKTFGKIHHTSFCYFYQKSHTAPDKFIECVRGNNAD